MTAAALFRVENLSLALTHAAAGLGASLQDLSFELQAGERVALVGAPGSGKSAVMRALALLQKPAAGRIYFEDQELTRLPDRKLRAVRRRFQYVGGHPGRALAPQNTVEDTLMEPLQIHRLGSRAEQRAQAQAGLTQAGLNPWLLARPIGVLSAALRQRVVLARALILQPRLLLTDEVIDHLEPSAVAPLLEYLSTWCQAAGLTWLWTTSDLVLARRYSGRVLRLDHGRLIPG
jgi:peptide/nickel transport system ATP-binding protein